MKPNTARACAVALAGVFLIMSISAQEAPIGAAGVAPAPSVAPPTPIIDPSVAATPSAPLSASAAVLRGLDKVTGKARDFRAPLGKAVTYGTLSIVVRACAKRPPEETPEVKVFVEVSDLKKLSAKPDDAKGAQIFSGWMFASSPAINALEHPVYDVWAIDCRA